MHFCSSFTPKFLLKLCGAASSQAQNGAVRELPPECYLCPSRLTKISNNLIVNIQQWAKRYFTEAKTHTGILVSAGTELVFFLVAGTGLRFGFENENNVDNTLKFQLLLSCAHPKSKIFQFPMLYQWGGAQEIWREHSQDRGPDLNKGILHTVMVRI